MYTYMYIYIYKYVYICINICIINTPHTEHTRREGAARIAWGEAAARTAQAAVECTAPGAAQVYVYMYVCVREREKGVSVTSQGLP